MVTKMADTIGDGIKQAMEHCSAQFKWKQWNCPKSAFSRRNSQKSSLTKEIAFTRALTTAGIMHALARRCSKSGRSQCECDEGSDVLQEAMSNWEVKSPIGEHKSVLDHIKTSVEIENDYDDEDEDEANEVGNEEPDVTWSWGGCSDDPGLAEVTTQNLLADLETGTDAYAFAEKQNNLVGRKVVKDSLKRVCRCHGLSGSCSHQTCWMQVAPFEEIAENLVKKYKRAIKISNGYMNSGWNSRNPADVPERAGRKIKTKQLVYLDESPDYCIPDESRGWPGTLGRLCNKENVTDPEERKSCQNLCRSCGYNLRKEIRYKQKRCNCIFKMCCEVKCDICEEAIEEYFCA
ncbi:protein Wnt-8b-like [Coccinella septempunctata]|uniref:protein Wnt-8b-like n=1 Tax=Coccinella septempunctata TaxID=41139 RepID=UPI001D07CB47|nr:protein Wnt-8b-like [Coccinella septempunctata]